MSTGDDLLSSCSFFTTTSVEDEEDGAALLAFAVCSFLSLLLLGLWFPSSPAANDRNAQHSTASRREAADRTTLSLMTGKMDENDGSAASAEASRAAEGGSEEEEEREERREGAAAGSEGGSEAVDVATIASKSSATACTTVAHSCALRTVQRVIAV